MPTPHQKPQAAKAQASAAGVTTPSKPLAIGKTASIIVTLAFGLFLVYGAGFAAPQAIHNMAHDARHSIAVPCH